MNTRQYLQLESIKACLTVLGAPAFRRPSINVLRAQLEKAAEEIQALNVTQVAANLSAKSDTISLAAARKDLRKRLFRISRHAVAVLDGVPGIRQDVRVPHANAKDADLIKAAGRIVRNLRPHMKSLYATGLPADAVTALQTAVRKLKSNAGASTQIARRSRATASLPAAIRRARALARALDSAVRSEIENEWQLHQWARVYRVPRKQGRPRKPRRAVVAPATTR